MDTVSWIATTKTKPPRKSEFIFELSTHAAEHNSQILKKHNYNLDKAIEANPNSIISAGSELRPIEQLDALLSHHPNFPRLKANTIHGIDYPAEDLPEEMRKLELAKQIDRGNHKSALTTDAEPVVNKLMKEDAALGYSISITKDCLLQLKGAELYPLGLQHQLTIDEKGNQIPKKRVTHDLSNLKNLGISINQRIDEDLVPETMYGHACRRFLHQIHNIRKNNPDKRILMCKSDFEKAYRRLHTTPRIAAKCISAWKVREHDEEGKERESFIASILTRLPFGSSPAPPEFSIHSETIFDLACDLLHCPHWDPETLPSPYDSMLPPPERLPDNVPFGEALEVDVKLPHLQRGGTDGYIDDGSLAVLDSPENKPMVARARQALQMASHLVFRPLNLDEPIQRPDAQSLRKLEAEGQLRETLVFLGWLIDSRALTIALPKEKTFAWIESIKKAITARSISFTNTQTLVGRLNHVGYIIPNARHFLNRIRRLEYVADKFGSAKIDKETILDLELWITLLQRAKRGMSINSVVFRTPTTVTLSDSCEFGMGGYCLKTGRAWRYRFTKGEREAFSLNLKEFIAAVICGKIFLPFDESPSPCLLSIGDSSCAVGWQYKSNFDPTLEPMHAEVAREHARMIMTNNACDYSQHIPGVTNVIADCLSRDFHLTNSNLVSMIYHTNPPYLPKQRLKIMNLPPSIVSWIGSLVQPARKRKVLPTQHTNICGLSDPYLDECGPPEKIRIIGAFMHAVRSGEFNPRSKQVSGDTARTAISHVAKTIVQSGRPDPTKDSTGKTDLRLLRQTRSYKNNDPPVRHQKALPPIVFEQILRSASTLRSMAIAELICAALFFACRSCEYSKTPQNERKKTRPLRPCDITFVKGPRIINQSSPEIFTADAVIAKFGSQKAGDPDHDDEVPMDRTDHPQLCPVRLWAKVISRLRNYPTFDPKWPVFTFYDQTSKKFQTIESKEISKAVKAAVKLIGKDKLGFGPDEVGTHSVRSALAMQLYLQHVPPYTIMMIGRWRSDAFLSYIEKQCHEFTKGMSSTMLTLNTFYQLGRHDSQHQPEASQQSLQTLHPTAQPRLPPNTSLRPNFHNTHFVHFGRRNMLRSHCRS